MKKFLKASFIILLAAAGFQVGDYYLKMVKIEDAFYESGFAEVEKRKYKADHKDIDLITSALEKRVRISGFLDSPDFLVFYGLPVIGRNVIHIKITSSDPMISNPLVPINPDQRNDLEKEDWIIGEIID